jgi:REP element-mobilizing transposase RayT
LDQARCGPRYLARPDVALLVTQALRYNAADLGHFELHAYAVMPNHVHVLLTPSIGLETLTRSLKTITARRANRLLGRTGQAFWQGESYDRLVRSREEFARVRAYVENNPVRAGLVNEPHLYPWSSASTMPAG